MNSVPGRRFPQPRDQSRQRGFAAAGGANDGERRSRRNVQIDVAQRRSGGRAAGAVG